MDIENLNHLKMELKNIISISSLDLIKTIILRLMLKMAISLLLYVQKSGMTRQEIMHYLLMVLEEMSLSSELTRLLVMSLVISFIIVDHISIATKRVSTSNTTSLNDLTIRSSLPMRLSLQTLFEHTRTIQNHTFLVSIKDTFLMMSIILHTRMFFRLRICFRTKTWIFLMFSSQTIQHVGIGIMMNVLKLSLILRHFKSTLNSMMVTLFVLMEFD